MEMDVNQRLAVETTGKNILVSASAGAGKTRVLVERLVKRCVKDRIGMDEILAVTFTEAAAAEMKNRIAASLQELSINPSSEEEEEWIRKQIVLLSNADITTIDSFCLNLIKKYYSVIGLDPAVTRNVLDESSRQTLLDEAFQKALIRHNAIHHDELLYLLKTSSPRSEDYDTLKTMITSIIDQCQQHESASEWLSRIRVSYDNIRSLNDLPEEASSAFFDRLKFEYDAICTLLDQMIQLASSSEKLSKKAKDLKEAQNLLLSCSDALNDHNYDHFRQLFLAFGADQKTPADTKAAEYTELRKYFYKKCDTLTGILYDSDVLIKDIKDLSPVVHLLCDLCEDTMTTFQKAKLETASMDFVDMEHYAWEILKRNNWEVARLFKNRLKEVMVDEFQDTSLLQDSIIKAVAPEGTIFRVGDVKQSIYRFRGARPALMRSLMSDPDVFNITLDHNYRSYEKIIRFSNLLFSRLMNLGGEDAYTDRDIVSPGTERQNQPDSQPIQLILIQKTEPDEQEEDESLDKESEAIKDKTMKAEWIANEMIRLHENGRHWNEFAVLVRSHAEKSILRRVFNAAHIPALIDVREGFYNSDLCLYILAVLSCITDPADDVALLTVLSGELFELPDELLAQWKLSCGSVRKGASLNRPDIFEWFSHLQETAEKSLCDVLNEIALYNRFYEKLRESEKANFDFLYEKTSAMSSSLFTLHDLKRMMETGTEEKSSAAVIRSRDDDTVTVTTIHQSKGLQYKVVFLWGSGKNPMMDSKNQLILDDSVGLGLKHYDLPWHTSRPSLFRIGAEHRQNIADVEEYTRVLYVALTRAEETMYIVDLKPNEQSYAEDLTLMHLAKRKGITGLITTAMTQVSELYEVHHVYPEELMRAPSLETRYTDILPQYDNDYPVLGALLRPSEHEIDALPSLSPGELSKGTRYGTMIHETIASLPDRMWNKDDFSSDVLRETDIAHILAFGNSNLYQKALTMQIRKEMPFYAEDPENGSRLMGVMDFVAFGEDEILLIDFKTDSASMEEIRRRYSSQLNLYRRALQILRPGIPVTAYAWSLHNSEAIEIR